LFIDNNEIVSWIWSLGASGNGNLTKLDAINFYGWTDNLGNGSHYYVDDIQFIQQNAAVNSISCNGGNDGSIDITVAGGITPYTYLWSTGSYSEDISGLTAGNYAVTITDANFCTINENYSIFEPDTISLNAVVSDETCTGCSDGAIDLTICGGTPPYSNVWGNGESTEDISNLAAGTYAVTVTDANGCFATETYTVATSSSPASLTFNVDMNYQIQQGNFNASTEFVDLAGTFNNWGVPGDVMSDINGDGIYTVQLSNFTIGNNIEFKFRINGDWGNAEFPGGSNRFHTVTLPAETLYFWYNDEQEPSADLLSMDLNNGYFTAGFQNMKLYISLANTGSQTINEFELSYQFDSDPVLIDYTGSLPIVTGDTLDAYIEHQINYPSTGMHTVSMWLSSVNGLAVNTGDTLSQSFEIINITNPAYAYIAWPYKKLTTFDLSAPDKVVVISEDPLSNDIVSSGTWYNNQYLCIKGSTDELIYFDLLFGNYTVIGPLGIDIRSLSYDNTNNILFGMASNGSLYQIDPNTAASTLIYQGTSSGFQTLASDLTGNLYSINYIDDLLYSINPVTGIATSIGFIGYDAYYSQGMEFDLNTGILYVSAFPSPNNSGELRSVNSSTGATTYIGSFPNNAQMMGLAIPYIQGAGTPGDYALSFDGVDEYLKVWGANTLPENDFTLEAWINASQLNDTHEILYWYELYDGVQFRVDSDGSLLYGESSNGAWQYVVSGALIDTNTWVHVAIVKDSNICNLFVNGISVASDTLDLNISPANMVVGARDVSNDRFFNGMIDDVRIWNVPRSQSQISSNLCMGTVLSDTTLIHRWQFSEGPGVLQVIDEISNRVAVLNNMEFVPGPNCDWINHTCSTGASLIADFTANVTTGTSPLTVEFADLSTGNPTSWLWDFGDGASDTLQNPVHIYQTAGIFNVSMVASNSNGSDTAIFQNYIEVIDSVQNTNTWTYTNTGNSHTILIQSTITVTIDGLQISLGDYLGIFYDSLGTQACAGYIEWTGQGLALTAWGDDAQTTEPDGFAAGETFQWKIWRASDDTVFNALANYMQPPIMPNTDGYVTNGMSGLTSLEAFTVNYQYISIPQGWSFFSSYIDPFEPNIDSLCAPFVSEVIIGKDGDGNTYWPQWGINTVGNILIGDGYQIKIATAQIMTVAGLSVQPENTPVTIDQGWSFLGYLRQSPAPLVSMLSPVVSEVVIVKNGAGQIYWPQWGINSIGDMIRGEGYQIKMNSQQILTYPANTVAFSKSEVILPKQVHFEKAKNTGCNMSLGLPTSDFMPGSEIAVFSQSGLLTGSAVANGDFTAITLWGDDETTPEIDGLIDGEVFIVKLWNGEESMIKIESWIEGDGSYETNKISVAEKINYSSPDSYRDINNQSFMLYQNVP
ncbi:MAG: LamG-like jellyroll fold domain-containing protein, partial [Bacteroidota bacterium]|nr:LamG-like jellyroll fold domain-containing protein [Bacteroidota bacterium]